MNPSEILRLVDTIFREKNVNKEIVFQAIEAALVSAAKGYYGDEAEIEFNIDRQSGNIEGRHNGAPLDAGETIGRIGAQKAKQVIIQKIREAERDALFDEYQTQIDQIVTGQIQRTDGGTATVSLGNVEAILPRSEQIPGESFHSGDRVRAVVAEVRKKGMRVQVVLSRTRPSLVQRLFDQEIPEIAEGVITMRSIAREPGYRSKVAVNSSDQRVDCVGACVGVRGNRIKNIVDELQGERIDIIRFSDNPQEMIPNALQPAVVDEVILCQMIGRAIVLVAEDQLSLAIGRRGQNVRLASKLCGWDIEIMTQEELEEQINRAVMGFSEIEGIDEELANRLVGEGYLSYDDLEVIEPDVLMELGGLTEEQVEHIVSQAEIKAEEAQRAAQEERRRQKEVERQEKATQATAAAERLAAHVSGETEQAPPAEEAEEEGAEEATAEEAAPEEEEGVSDEGVAEATAEETTEPGEADQELEPQEVASEQGAEPIGEESGESELVGGAKMAENGEIAPDEELAEEEADRESAEQTMDRQSSGAASAD
jgi:N utilization substance protein A